MRSFTLLTYLLLLFVSGVNGLDAHQGKLKKPKPPPPPPPPDPRHAKPGSVVTGNPFGGKTGSRPPPSPVTPPPIRAGSPVTSGKKRRGETTEPGWQCWWMHNREPYLLLKMNQQQYVISGSAGFLAGMGRKESTVAWNEPSRVDVLSIVVPALRSAMASDEKRIVDSATLALGKVTPAVDAAVARDDLERVLTSRHASVRQAALLGLGLLGQRSSIPILWAVMNDTSPGRSATGATGIISKHDRAIAALALGYVSEEGPMASQLRRLVERARNQDVEVIACAVLALGLAKDAAHETVPFLSRHLHDRGLDRRVRAQIPISLARLGDAARPTVPILLKISRSSKEDHETRLSAVIALGELAASYDSEVVDGLRQIIRREKRPALRQFAYMSLGRIAARIGADHESSTDILGYLASEVADPGRQIDLEWAALAAGVAGSGMPSDAKQRSALASQIGALLKRTGNPSTVGALATTLGLLRAKEAGPLLLRRYQNSSDTDLKGHLALAMGMMQYHQATEPLRRTALEHTSPHLRVQAATALGLLGDREASEHLLDMLADSPSYATTVTIGRALGQIGDRRSLTRLATLATDTDQPIAVRSYACVSLGLIAEKTELPWNTRLSVGANYLIGLKAQDQVLDLF